MAPKPTAVPMEPPLRVLAESDFEALLDSAAKRGAQEALRQIGLHDEDAGNDLRDLRQLLQSYRRTQSEVLSAVVKTITVALLAALVVGIGSKLLGLGGSLATLPTPH